jgi:hypothetical protein
LGGVTKSPSVPERRKEGGIHILVLKPFRTCTRAAKQVRDDWKSMVYGVRVGQSIDDENS